MKNNHSNTQLFFDFDSDVQKTYYAGMEVSFIDPVFKVQQTGVISTFDGLKIKIIKVNENNTRYFTISESDIVPQEEKQSQKISSAVKSQESQNVDFKHIDFTGYHFYGSWINENDKLSPKKRKELNDIGTGLLTKNRENLTENDLYILRQYSGWGGIDTSERGVLYDFYTSPPVADLTWKLLNKIQPLMNEETLLEPSCGTGVFFETAPDTLKLTGVELDNRTGSIAALLHPKAHIIIGSFEQFNLTRQEKFDRVIGNAPFGERSVSTSFLDMFEEKNLDRYFISRSIDNLKDNGTMALIVHPGILNNASNHDWRATIQHNAQFLGAVRLPDSSFRHTQTQVQPDILFFRKYPEDIRLRLEQLPSKIFQRTDFYQEQWVEGTYYATHETHILGTISVSTGQWGQDEIKGKLTNTELQSCLNTFTPEAFINETAYEAIRQQYPLAEKKQSDRKTLQLSLEEAQKVANKELQTGDTKTVDDKIYTLSADFQWVSTSEANTVLSAKIERLKEISSQIQFIRSEMQFGSSVDELQIQTRKNMEKYQETFNTFPADDPEIKKYLKANPAVAHMYEGLVSIDCAILTEGNIYENHMDRVNGHNPAVEALAKLHRMMKEGSEKNIRQYFPNQSEILLQQMMENEDIFLTTQLIYQLREDFISGNAWEKIDSLKESAANATGTIAEKLLYGVSELEKALGWVNIEEVSVTPHSSWLPENIIRNWAIEENGAGYKHEYEDKTLIKNTDGKWGVSYDIRRQKVRKNWSDPLEYYETNQWYEHSHELVYYLNMQKQRSTRNDTTVFNQTLNENFVSWLANHESHRETIENLYNRNFNCEIGVPTKTYPVYLKGWQENKTLQPHQWQTIHHLYKQKTGISALCTGGGKTLSAIGLASLLLQEGKINRAWIQVPNNKVKDWVEEIQAVMPVLRIGFVDPETKGYGNRQTRYQLYQELANNKYDLLIMPESSASEIQLMPKNDITVSDKVIDNYLLDKTSGSKKVTARKIQTVKGRAETKLINGKTNITINFEDFGCDAIFIDEAHRYKNLFTSSLSRETGMNDGRASEKALSLYKKTAYIRHEFGGNIFLFTATPLTNSPLEYYNMMMYVAPNELEKLGIYTIDGFIKNFADIKEGFKYDWSSGQIREGKILAGFKEIRTLQDLFFKYTDLQNDPDKINLKKPKANNRPNVILPESQQVEVIKAVSARLEQYKAASKEDRELLFSGENFLTFYSRMRTASLDIELYDPQTYKNWQNPKLEKLARNAKTIYDTTKAGQVVFCDRVFSSDNTFNMHDKIKETLVQQGFKESDIVIVNGFTKSGGTKGDTGIEKEVSAAVEDYNNGKYKVIIGTTACIGEGLNLQKNSAALHHLDIPFRPSDFIQRNGRIDRQGNAQVTVELHTYLSSGTIDNYSVSLVQSKADWIDKLLKTKSNVFTNPNDENFIDPDELLLALSAEWGDTEKITERRAELERMKEEKIIEAQNSKRIEGIASLSLMRNSISAFSGDKGSSQYQTRIRKILNLEKSLQANPTFHTMELIQSTEAFLFNRDKEIIIRKNDAFVLDSKKYRITDLNHIKQSITAKYILTSPYGLGSINQTQKFPIKEMQNVSKYFVNPTEQEFQNFCTLGTDDFYTLGDTSWKEQNYLTHLEVGLRNNLSNTQIFFTIEENKPKLKSFHYEFNNSKKNIYNIFNDNERVKLLSDIQKEGLTVEKYWKNQFLVLLKDIHPDIFREIERYITTESEANVEEPQASYGEPYDFTGFSAEETEIALQALQNDIFLKTPNGEISQLTPKQWVYARTESFKNQYGDWQKAYFEKGLLLDNLSPKHDRRETNTKPLYNHNISKSEILQENSSIYDKRLLQILQTDFSVKFDKNFEPLPKYCGVELYDSHGTYVTKKQFIESKYEAKAIVGKILAEKQKDQPPGLWKSFKRFKTRGVFDIIGEKIAMNSQGHISPYGYKQLAAALQIYRNKKFETMRYLFIDKQGELQDQITVSSSLPSRTLAVPGYGKEVQEKFFSSCLKHAQATNTRIVIVHNHPSGNIEPSIQDINLTQVVRQRFDPYFGGHIILDHGKFSLYESRRNTWLSPDISVQKDDPLLKKKNKFANIILQNEQELLKVGKIVQSIDSKLQWNEKDWVPFFFANSGLKINAVNYVSKNDILNLSETELLKKLTNTAKSTGSPFIFPIVNNGELALAEKLTAYFNKGSFFTDMLINGKDFFKKGTGQTVDILSEVKPRATMQTTINDFSKPYNPLTGRIYPESIKRHSAAEQADNRFLTLNQVKELNFTIASGSAPKLLSSTLYNEEKEIVKHRLLINGKDIKGLPALQLRKQGNKEQITKVQKIEKTNENEL